MNNGNAEPKKTAGNAIPPTRIFRPAAPKDELSRLKNELFHAEVRLAKARATVAGAEIDIEVLNVQLSDIICVHNHPSGDPVPSAVDIRVHGRFATWRGRSKSICSTTLS